MALNEVHWDPKNISLPVGVGVKSGDPVRVGSVNGFVTADDGVLSGNKISTSNAPGWASVKTSGAFKTNVAITGSAAAGAAIYATTPGANKVATLTNVVGGAVFGWVYEAVAAGASVPTIVVLSDSPTV